MEFEKRILASEKNNVKFNFLLATDPYHGYYKMRVSRGDGSAIHTIDQRAAFYSLVECQAFVSEDHGAGWTIHEFSHLICQTNHACAAYIDWQL